MTEPIVPFWFRQRQGNLEAAGENTYRLTAPNQGEAFISILPESEGGFRGRLRLAADGPDVAVTDEVYDDQADAWGAAFELYRTHVVV